MSKAIPKVDDALQPQSSLVEYKQVFLFVFFYCFKYYPYYPGPLREGTYFSFKHTSPETWHATICDEAGETQWAFDFPAVKPVV